MQLKILTVLSIFQAIHSVSLTKWIPGYPQNTPYQIQNIEGPRAQEIKTELNRLNLNSPSNFILNIKYTVTDHQKHPHIHITYTIQTPTNEYTYSCVVKASNSPLPWQANSSFPPVVAFYLNLHIQKSINFIKRKEDQLGKQNNILKNQDEIKEEVEEE